MGERLPDTDGVGQLETEAVLLVERRADIPLERLETAVRPYRRLSLLCAQRKSGADGKDVRDNPQQPARRVAHEVENLVQLCSRREDVRLVDDDDDLFAPVADRLQ